MQPRNTLSIWILNILVLSTGLAVGHPQVGAAASAGVSTIAGATAESIDALYEKAKKEGGKFTLYAPLSTRTQEFVLPIFEKRFPGIKIDHIDATSDALVTRAVTEARGGKVFGDIFAATLAYITRMRNQKLLVDMALPEAAAYPNNLKGSYWVATDTQFYVAGWNTNLLKKGKDPRQFEDFADPRWKKRLIAEPRDFQLLLGLAKYKYNSDEKAIDLLKKIALNNVEFHKGHSQLAELLVAGQAEVCMTCYSHHFPPRIKKGGPIQSMLTEGVGEVGGTVAIFKDAPHPNAALLWARWIVSEEGQKVYAQAGETPAHPKVEPVEKTRPAKIYPLTVDDVREFPKYEKLWKEIFQLR